MPETKLPHRLTVKKMTFINDALLIMVKQFRQIVFSCQCLHNSNVNYPSQFVFTAAEHVGTNSALVHRQPC